MRSQKRNFMLRTVTDIGYSIPSELRSFNVYGTDEIFKFIEIMPKHVLFLSLFHFIYHFLNRILNPPFTFKKNYDLKAFSDPVDHQSPVLYESPFVIISLFIYGWRKGTTKQEHENCTLFWLRRQIKVKILNGADNFQHGMEVVEIHIICGMHYLVAHLSL